MTGSGWVDSDEYLTAMEAALSPMRGTWQYEPHRHAWTDYARFNTFIDQLERFSSVSGKRVYDSGCGAGGLCIAAKERGAREVTGLEISEVTGALAEKRLSGRPGFRILRALSQVEALPPCSFDVIFSLHVVEHVHDSAEYLAGLRRLLAHDGWLLLATPHRLWPVEQHTRVPLLHYLPRRFSQRASEMLARAPFISSDARLSLRAVSEPSLFWFFELRRAVQRAGFDIVDHNSPGTLTERLQRRGLSGLATISRAIPRPALGAVAMIASPSINLICRAR